MQIIYAILLSKTMGEVFGWMQTVLDCGGCLMFEVEQADVDRGDRISSADGGYGGH